MENMLRSSGMTNQEYNILIERLRKEVEREENTELHIRGISRGEFFKTYIISCKELFKDDRKKALKLFKSPKSMYAKLSLKGVAYEKEKKAYVVLPFYFINDYDFFRNFSKKHELAFKVFTFYHETKHLLQDIYSKQNIYDWFCNQMCSLCSIDETKYYNDHHDSFYHEIDANLYGIKKTTSFLKRYPKLYEENKEYIEQLRIQHEFYKNNFDFDTFLAPMLKSTLKTTYFSSKTREEHRGDFNNLLNNYIIPDIMHSTDFYKTELLYSIFSNPNYFKTIDFNYLDLSTKYEIIKALKWKEKKLIERQRFNSRFLYSKNGQGYKERINDIYVQTNKQLRINENMLHYTERFLPKYNIQKGIRDTITERNAHRK